MSHSRPENSEVPDYPDAAEHETPPVTFAKGARPDPIGDPGVDSAARLTKDADPEPTGEPAVVESFAELVEQTHTAAVLDPTAKAVLTVSNLKMYFPVRSGGIVRRKIGDVQAVDGIE